MAIAVNPHNNTIALIVFDILYSLEFLNLKDMGAELPAWGENEEEE